MEAIGVTVYPVIPIQSAGVSYPLYIAMRYAGTSQLNQQSIKLADGTKIFYPYNNRAKTFMYKMENYQGLSGYNFMAWHDTDDHNYDTHLWFYSGTTQVTYSISINIRVVFAQPTPIYTQSRTLTKYEIVEGGKTVKRVTEENIDGNGKVDQKEESEYVD